MHVHKRNLSARKMSNMCEKCKNRVDVCVQVLVDELEERMEQCHRKGLDDGEIAHRASKSSNLAQQHAKKGSKTSGHPARTPGTKP